MITALRGMKDMLQDRSKLYEYIVKTCEDVAKNYGYTQIKTPHLEETALFKRSVGESSDIVGKEMYQFTDKGNNDVCLRPEGTAGVVRAYIEAKLDRAGGVYRWFYHGSMFRYERPQKGRLREFHQFGVECFGEASVYEDASIILMISEILKRLDIKATLKINSLGDVSSMASYKEKLVKFLDANESEICDDCLRRKELNPIRTLDCKNEKCQEIYQNAPLMIENLSKEAADDFDKLKKILDENNIGYEVDPKLVRGLDYYCKTAFEFISNEIGSQSAVAGGGRYDRLVEYLGGKASYGVGFAMGIERIMEILSSRDIKNERNGVYICALDEQNLDFVYSLGTKMRDKFKVEISYEAKKLQKHLQIADNKGAKIFLCIGENERANSQIWYKNLDNKTEKTINLNELEKELDNE
ncbi:histidine--tRNA ligase [Campylobacter sp. RM9344]|uniref:Histidine--tRNA ligase n=1 Tax=Campylobacter californiensis TaxID=1032243 RepID=A0AAW3ZXX8_9BACT|nr:MULTISPECIES: histidine--tRNA ligase [unclassified Campylobacter]MBE2984259.1 histidine--tRNA ligase [Campylobacter sp. RM6883]MBE2985986.1 histidine--tRNA ligase [Campylobacter sp. RM12919]MBE2988334.1 histidine--tRNA ligase [Campylobacter sp. RM12920]MBE2994874.1 histidine--tRNA ligase [Campylobacter sp. RM6913]MBE3029488.1 histidine--tRNA ligase [Campylobacter sp. RM9344]